ALRFGRTRPFTLGRPANERRALLSLYGRAFPGSIAVRSERRHVVVARRRAALRRSSGVGARRTVDPVANTVAQRAVPGARRTPCSRRPAHGGASPGVAG